MRHRVHHVAGIQHPDRHVSLAGAGPHVSAVRAHRDPVRVGRVGGSTRRVVVQRSRDGGWLFILDHGQRIGIQPPAHPVAVDPALGGQIGDQNPLAVHAARQRLDPRAHGQRADRRVVEAGTAPHVDARRHVDPVDVRRGRWIVLRQQRPLHAPVREQQRDRDHQGQAEDGPPKSTGHAGSHG